MDEVKLAALKLAVALKRHPDARPISDEVLMAARQFEKYLRGDL